MPRFSDNEKRDCILKSVIDVETRFRELSDASNLTEATAREQLELLRAEVLHGKTLLSNGTAETVEDLFSELDFLSIEGMHQILKQIQVGLISCEPGRDDQQLSPHFTPPNNAEFLLYLLISPGSTEDIIGDLVEECNSTILPKFGDGRARFWFWMQAVRSIWTHNKLTVFFSKIGDVFKRFSSG